MVLASPSVCETHRLALDLKACMSFKYTIIEIFVLSIGNDIFLQFSKDSWS